MRFLAFEYVVDGDEHLAGYGGDGFLVSTPSGDAEIEWSQFRVEA
jgi:NAD kinase